MLTPKIIRFLKKKEFISICTCGMDNIPLAAPKLLLRVEPDTIYLIDFVMGRIWKNLSVNPRVSLSVMDHDELTGYQINGLVEIINEGKLYDELLAELQKKEISLTAERIIEGSRKGKKHESFEISFPERFIVFKINIDEILEIYHSGKIKRDRRSTENNK